jgi:spore coat polysaccharide biosynthesis predicted glycosyltransferase SpsG
MFKNLKVILRVDTSLQMDAGHVMFYMILVQSLKENVANIEFICRKHEKFLIDKICSSKFKRLD